jgi:hypothetical protein
VSTQAGEVQLGWSGPNPVFAHVRRWLPDLDEARFVERVSRSLLVGDFDLIVAGDGIRSDLQAIAGHLNGHGGSAARLALVEFQLWSDAAGQTLVVPSVPLRTQVIEHRVVLDRQGIPLPLAPAAEADEVVETVIDPEQATLRDRNRAFWQGFIDAARFDHPDQPPPRHGGRNWVRLDLPIPGRMTAYRTANGKAGIFISLPGEEGAEAFAALESEADDLRRETGLDLVFRREKEQPFLGTISLQSATTDDRQLLAWLTSAANCMVNVFRPRLATMTRVA